MGGVSSAPKQDGREPKPQRASLEREGPAIPTVVAVDKELGIRGAPRKEEGVFSKKAAIETSATIELEGVPAS